MNESFLIRRQHLLKQMLPQSVAIVVAAPEMIRNADCHYRYRQNSNFYYLTGFEEPQAIALICKKNGENKFILFNRAQNPKEELWTGIRAGQEGAIKDYNADKSYAITEIELHILDILEGIENIYFTLGKNPFDRQLITWLEQLRKKNRSLENKPSALIDLDNLLHEMRLIKDATEIEYMRKAANISSIAHEQAMKVCKPGMYEYELEAEIAKEFIRHGSQAPAYTTIVGGGKNACTLHYESNNQKLNDGDLVLIDAGCEYNYYASDITRTFPVNGHFKEHQKALYNLVLEAQIAGIKKIKPGNTWIEVQETIIPIITEGLLDLGILKGSLKKLLAEKAYLKFYMHNSGHWLGLDTHDSGSYKIKEQWREFKTGMVLTVEPGIYIRSNNPEIESKWWDMGIRIEDDILVTPHGHEILSKHVAKTVSEIETIMNT